MIADTPVSVDTPLDRWRPVNWRWRNTPWQKKRGPLLDDRRDRLPEPEWLDLLIALKDSTENSKRPRRPEIVVPPELIAAHRIYKQNGQPRWEMQARLLAGQSDQEISSAMGYDTGVVAAYAACFYDIRDRLSAADYVNDCVIRVPLAGLKEGDLKKLWAYFAFNAGPKIFELIKAVSLDHPLPDWACRDAPDARERLRLSTKLAIMVSTAPLTRSKLRKLKVLKQQVLELKDSRAPPTPADMASFDRLELLELLLPDADSDEAKPAKRKFGAVA